MESNNISKQYSISAKASSQNDPRRCVLIERGYTKLRVAGHDMLPHKFNPDGTYKRIQWEEFRQILTQPETQEPTTAELANALEGILELVEFDQDTLEREAPRINHARTILDQHYAKK